MFYSKFLRGKLLRNPAEFSGKRDVIYITNPVNMKSALEGSPPNFCQVQKGEKSPISRDIARTRLLK